MELGSVMLDVVKATACNLSKAQNNKESWEMLKARTASI